MKKPYQMGSFGLAVVVVSVIAGMMIMTGGKPIDMSKKLDAMAKARVRAEEKREKEDCAIKLAAMFKKTKDFLTADARADQPSRSTRPVRPGVPRGMEVR